MNVWHANVSDVLCDVRVILGPLCHCHGYQQQLLCCWSSWMDHCGLFTDSYLGVSVSPISIILTSQHHTVSTCKSSAAASTITHWFVRFSEGAIEIAEKMWSDNNIPAEKYFIRSESLAFHITVNKIIFNRLSWSSSANGICIMRTG